MLISHRYKFIYLRTEKTASTSLLSILRDIVENENEDDLLMADWSVRKNLLREGKDLSQHSFQGGGGYLSRRINSWRGIHRHGPVTDVRRFLGQELFSDYLIITSERNPWDRQVSLFSDRRTKHPARNIRDFKSSMHSKSYNILHHNRLDNWGIYTIDDVPVAHHVIRFENLEEDYQRVLEALGIDPGNWPLPHRRAKARFGGADYRDYYDDSTRELIGQWYSKEIAHFGYKF